MENNTKQKSLKVNAALNIIKQICSILFPMITFPYASRVLGKVSYGKINFGQSIISYITMIAGLGITNYSIREGAKIRNDRDKINKFANEVFSINVISTVIAYLILFLLIIFWKRLDGYKALLLIQSLTVLFTTIGTDWLNSIYEDYLYLTIRYIVCYILSLVLMFTLVHSSNDYLFYALSSVASTVLANILNIGYIRKTYKIHIRFTFHVNAAKHLKPIMIMFGTSVASLIYINSDVTMLGILKDEAEVGLYSVSSKIYSLVKQLMNAMLVVAIPRISHEIGNSSKQEVQSHLRKIIDDLFVMIVPACVGLLFLSKDIILLFSGAEYESAYTSLMILSIALLFACTACFYINVVMIPYCMENKVLGVTIVSAVVNIVLNLFMIPYWGQNAAALTTLISEFIVLSAGIVYTRKIIPVKFSKSIIIGIVNGIAVAAVCMVVQHLNLGSFMTIILSMLFSIIGVGIVLYFGDRDMFISLKTSLLSKVKKN